MWLFFLVLEHFTIACLSSCKRGKDVCLAVKGPFAATCTSPRTCPNVPKHSDWTMKNTELERNGEMIVGWVLGRQQGRAVKSQIHEFSFARFQKFYTQIFHFPKHPIIERSSNIQLSWKHLVANSCIATTQTRVIAYILLYLYYRRPVHWSVPLSVL